MKRWLLPLGAVVVAVGAAFAVMSLRGARLSRQPQRFVLIVCDSLRADHLGCYGHPKRLTPNIDALAARALRFENAFAASSWTFGSNSALLTGRYSHEVYDPRAIRLSAQATTLAEHFRATGYITAGFSAHFCISKHFNFEQGFDHFMLREQQDTEIIGACSRWLSRHRNDRYFVLLYLWHPHAPYRPTRISPDLQRRLAAMRPSVRRGVILLGPERRCPRITPAPDSYEEYSRAEIEALHQLYQGNIADADALLAPILRSVGADPRAAIALTGDHGEEWLEHGGLGHKWTLYRELLHVPLILRAPGRAPRVIGTPVSHLDVVPTFLALARIPLPADLRGRFLLAQLNVQPVFSEVGIGDGLRVHRCAVRLGDQTLIYSLKDLAHEPPLPPGGVWERYDLKRDPKQQVRLPVSRGDEVWRLLNDYHEQALERLRPYRNLRRKPLDERTAEKMRALGYIGR